MAEYSDDPARRWQTWLHSRVFRPRRDRILVRYMHLLGLLEDRLGRFGLSDRIRYVPPGVDADSVPLPSNRTDSELPLVGLDLEAVSPDDAEFFLDTIEWFPEGLCRVTVLGERGQRERLRARLRSHPSAVRRQVCFAASRDEPDENWARCLISLHTLNRGRASMHLLDAMACSATPIIASSQTTDLVEEGVTGVFVDARSPFALSTEIQALCKDAVRTRAMGLAARKTVLRRHSLAQVTEILLALYGDASSHLEGREAA